MSTIDKKLSKSETFAVIDDYVKEHYSIKDENNLKFIMLPIPLQADKNLTANDKAILAKIEDLAKQSGFCYASDNRLSEYVGCHIKTVTNSVRKLTKLGYIYKKSRFTDNDITTTQRKIYVNPIIKQLFDEIRKNKVSNNSNKSKNKRSKIDDELGF